MEITQEITENVPPLRLVNLTREKHVWMRLLTPLVKSQVRKTVEDEMMRMKKVLEQNE